ncbi:N-acetyltransferase [Pedobacter sp. N36a]|uniref:GNAT family N-acetyltransferase n=1 Tax=Pedobacter sp. N36a TaxID=2767996 RepID=UPI00165751B4|nr:GNAT family N-acetyltransferase [Pedobacter sp. N36a]MBC8985992.1 N-acetyltransferase [Pedobacter sp. N36a]
MKIEHLNENKGGYFKALNEGKTAAIMNYAWAGPGKIVIEHTEVKPDYSGQGLGKDLVFAAVDYARLQKVKILPLCPFAKSIFNKNESLNDVLF